MSQETQTDHECYDRFCAISKFVVTTGTARKGKPSHFVGTLSRPRPTIPSISYLRTDPPYLPGERSFRRSPSAGLGGATAPAFNASPIAYYFTRAHQVIPGLQSPPKKSTIGHDYCAVAPPSGGSTNTTTGGCCEEIYTRWNVARLCVVRRKETGRRTGDERVDCARWGWEPSEYKRSPS